MQGDCQVQLPNTPIEGVHQMRPAQLLKGRDAVHDPYPAILQRKKYYKSYVKTLYKSDVECYVKEMF